MVFSSFDFIFKFMPLFFVCYYLLGKKNVVLFIGSMIFYLLGTIAYPLHFIIFIISMILGFAFGCLMEDYPHLKKLYLIVCVLIHVITLFLFKYAGFVINDVLNINSISIDFILPIGISFYTFQGISYIVDVYRGKIKAERSLLCYCVYISMFAQLIAGPIVKYSDIKEQLHNRRITSKSLINGLCIFVLGLGLKVLIANPLSKLWSQTCGIGFESISTLLAWIAIMGYSFHIYFDFYGYSLMAIGLGEMLGFKLPMNFNSPYKSTSMSEFWRRWHMTLGSWFREYVYIPLGGNKKGLFRTFRNLAVVWLLTGIWHGADYHFVLWGVALFVLIVFEKFVIGKYLKRHRFFGHVYMVFAIALTWSIFAIDDISSIILFISRLFGVGGIYTSSSMLFDYVKYFGMYYPFLLIGLLLSIYDPYQLFNKIRSYKYRIVGVAVIFLASVYCLYMGLNDPFLYFRF